MQTLHESKPHFPSFPIPKNPEEISLKTQLNTASSTRLATHMKEQFFKANGKPIFTPFYILFFIKIFPSLTSIFLLERGVNRSS